MSISVPVGYEWVLLICVITSLQLLVTGFIAGSMRSSIFTKEFFEKNFPEFKDKIPQGGYPDNGAGKFAQKLTTEQWMHFNNGQRTHYNYLEGIIPILATSLTAGLVYTRLTVIIGIVYIIGREFYRKGYTNQGPKGRLIGALVLDAALVTNMITSIMALVSIGGGYSGFVEFIVGK